MGGRGAATAMVARGLACAASPSLLDAVAAGAGRAGSALASSAPNCGGGGLIHAAHASHGRTTMHAMSLNSSPVCDVARPLRGGPSSSGRISISISSMRSGSHDARSSGPNTTAISSSRTFSSSSGCLSSEDGSSSSSSSSKAPSSLRVRLLDIALTHVPTHGWSHGALVAAAHDLNLSPAVTGLLSRREGELVEHHLRLCNARLSSQMGERSAELKEAGSLRARLLLVLRARLEMIVPHMEQWPQALAVATAPSNLPHSLALLGELVDDMWHLCGDASTDYSWYTKRAMLSAVYTSTELYMLTDYSPGFADTWAALDRRLGDMLTLGNASTELPEAVASAAAAAMQAAAATAAHAAQGKGQAKP